MDAATLHVNKAAAAAAADDSDDNDEVTDFLNSNQSEINGHASASSSSSNYVSQNFQTNVANNSNASTARSLHNAPHSPRPLAVTESQNYCIPVINAPPHTTNNNSSNNNNSNNNSVHHYNSSSNNNNNMIPIINVTPHSPSASASKYNNIFEDTLSQLQNIRESVVQMKNSSVAHMHDGSGAGGAGASVLYSQYGGLLNAAILSASLPDLNTAANGASATAAAGPFGAYVMWSPQQQLQCLLSTTDHRRKSWTAIDDLTAGADCTNKSVSLSSLDSEEQETIRVTEQRRRSARNSTGGISTHSLNEAELARDFERIAAKRSLATEIISRIPLQKSISTSSIVAKEEIKAIARHLTDSEDEQQSLLRAHHTKIEVYDNNNVEKRRKRGSLFFRNRKKDKAKAEAMKAATGGSGGGGGAGHIVAQCDACGAPITLATVKEHQLECKGKKSSGCSGGGVRKGAGDSAGVDYYDGPGPDASTNYTDDTPLIRSEFLNEPPIEAQDLGADPALGITLDEHDSWSPSVPKEVLKSLKEKQIKRQEHIYEFIMTEKHHCQTLLVMQKVFVESLERHFPALNINSMFPRLAELTELHTAFLKRLRQKQREQYIVDSIADILLEFFSHEKAQHLRLAYGEFCANHRSALEQFKACMTGRPGPSFAEWYRHCLANPLLKKKGIPECILFVTQRLTKYPLLIEPLLKSAREEKLETDKLQHALNLVKALLVDVDACVAERELRERQVNIYQRMDAKSFAIYKNKPFRNLDVSVESRRRLKFEGLATLMQGRSKMQLVLIVVLTDCLCFLTENSAHNKYTFFTPEHKAGVVPLQKLLIREKAGTESRGIYIISSNPDFPEMYELKVQQPKDKNTWIQSIRQAVLECPSSDVIETQTDLTAEQKLRIGVNKRELLEKMRQKDIEQALLLEEKLLLQLHLLKEQKHFGELSAETASPGNSAAAGANGGNLVSAANFLAAFGSYKDLVGVDCDTAELWKRVVNMVQDIGQLAAAVYTAATGLPVSRSVSSVGEKQSDTYASPTLPKRAETFAGFDEKRAKNIFPCRGVGVGVGVMSARLQELEEPTKPKSAGSGGLLASMLHSSATAQAAEQSCADQTTSPEQLALKEHNYAALQVSHHLHTLLCIISQQMTTIYSLQQQQALYRESPRAVYTHNDQLEELRNLQDKLQEEKTAWQRQREQQAEELEEQRTQQAKLQAQIKAEQEDIKQQREQLYRKMELLSSQGLLLSPSMPPLMISSSAAQHVPPSSDDGHEVQEGTLVDAPPMAVAGANVAHTHVAPASTLSFSTVDRRKDKWRTASTISKTPPGNLLSATNAPKSNQTNVKQKLPMKLSSLSSNTNSTPSSGGGGATSRIDKSASFNASNSQHHHASAANIAAVGVTQMLPFKLADKRAAAAASPQIIVPQHSRTGSSPAIIQQATATSPPPSTQLQSGTAAHVTRTDSASTFTYGQRHHSVSTTPTSSRMLQSLIASSTAASLLSSSPAARSTNSTPTNAARGKPAEEEEIYF